MTRHDDDEMPICKDCGDPITDAYTSPDYCTDCLDRGDGMIFVSPVELAVKIRSGAIGEDAL